MFLRTGWGCLAALYDEPATAVVDLLESEEWRSKLGEWDEPLEEGRLWWSGRCEIQNCGISVSVFQSPHGQPFSMLVLGFRVVILDRMRSLFEELQRQSILPREVLIADEEEHSVVPEMIGFCYPEWPIEEHLDSLEGNNSALSIHSIRAYRKDIIDHPPHWSLAAQERGLHWKEDKIYFHLDVHWKDRLQDPPHLDPTSQALNEHPLQDQLESQMEGTTGTAFLIKLSREDLNPARSHARWCEILPPIVKTLKKHGLVGRYYSFLNLLLVRPDISKEQAEEERENLFDLLEDLGTSNSEIEMMSWPEDLVKNEGLFCSLIDLV